VIPLTRAFPERIRRGLRRCAIQIDVYCTLTDCMVYNINISSLIPSRTYHQTIRTGPGFWHQKIHRPNKRDYFVVAK